MEDYRVLPDALCQLAHACRPVLFEVACSPDSVLTKTMQQVTGNEASARRLSYFNGFDLSTGKGVRQVLQEIYKCRPVHVWLSLECGPYSRMQNLNRRNEQQRRDLEAKRTAVLKQYVGGLVVYLECHRLGITATWEWSETCEAWRLPMVQKTFAKVQPKMCVVKGCAVGLRSRWNEPVGKGWKLATTHQLLSERMRLPCMCEAGVRHAVCEGSLTRESAYYTPKFAERVVQALKQGCSHVEAMMLLQDTSYSSPRERLAQEGGQDGEEFTTGECECDVMCHPRCDTLCAACERAKAERDPMCFGTEPAAVPLTAQEREHALRRIGLIHRATGHGPMSQVITALERRGTDARVVELARKYECPVCREAKPRLPKKQASLEGLPPKWAVVQADNGQWTHPATGEKVQFMMMIDEASRFRVARLLEGPGAGGVKSSQLIQVYQENWKPIFGHPACIGVDPEGAWRAHALEDFFESQNVELVRIPAEAHCQISYVERAIQCAKSVMSKIAADDPDVTPAEALSEAVRTANEKEIVRGYTPAQHALGRAPDQQGRFHGAGPELIPELVIENPEGEFARNWQRMQTAEKAFIDWTFEQRLGRARNSRGRAEVAYSPGDLVYYWRFQKQDNPREKVGRSMALHVFWRRRLGKRHPVNFALAMWCGSSKVIG